MRFWPLPALRRRRGDGEATETPLFPPLVRARLEAPGPGKDRVIGADAGGFDTGGGGGIVADALSTAAAVATAVEEAEVDKALVLDRSFEAEVDL